MCIKVNDDDSFETVDGEEMSGHDTDIRVYTEATWGGERGMVVAT